MTVPNGSILFNSSTGGSDTAASGLGPATAVTGSSAELDGTATVDVSADGTGLTGITVGDLLFCLTSSGRQFSIIASIDVGLETITTDEDWPTESSVQWAVGGKRATLDNSQQLWEKDVGILSSTATLELETDQTMSSYGTAKYGDWEIKSSVAGTKRVINCGGSYFVRGGGWVFRDIHFKSSANGYLGRADTSTQSSTMHLYDCIVGDSTDKFITTGTESSRTFTIYARGTVFQNFSGPVFGLHNAYLDYCLVKDCDGAVFSAYSYTYYHHFARQTVFTNCLTFSYQRRSGNTNIQLCIIHGMTSTGQIMSYQDYAPGHIINNIWMDNAGSIEEYTSRRFFGNAYYNNTVSYPPSMGSASIILTADPFTDAASGDFSLNSDTGGGAVLRAISETFGSTTGYPFNWLTDGSGGGGGSSRLINGGLIS